MHADRGPILFAYDGSDNAKHAIAGGGELLAREPALVVTVWESALALAYRHSMPGELALVREVVEEIDTTAQEAAEATAGEGAELTHAAGLDSEPLAERSDRSLSQALVDLAHARSARAVVLGSRGRSGVASVLLGSFSYGVVHHCRCPVLTAPPPEA
jgi:nucleotide-binding universal stress UspA family protein